MLIPPAAAQQLPKRKRSGPVVIAGYQGEGMGLSISAQLTGDALAALGADVIPLPMAGVLYPQHFSGRPAITAGQLPDTGLFMVVANPPSTGHALHEIARVKPKFLDRAFSVVFLAWELPKIPEDWVEEITRFDQIWVPSIFVRKAVLARLGGDYTDRVRVVPHPVPNMDHIQPDRKRFGLPEDKMIVLTAFNMRSKVVRKNPLATIKAFKRAAGSRNDAMLLLKIAMPEGDPEALHELQKISADDPRIRIIADTMSDNNVRRLMASCDIYMSLHRAEGFGLTLAEAMRFGKPVVATAYSGNMDFMDEKNAMLVACAMIDVCDTSGLFREGQWAEPDIAHAARNLRRLFSNAGLRQRLGREAKKTAQAKFGLRAFSQEIADVLAVYGRRQDIAAGAAGKMTHG